MILSKETNRLKITNIIRNILVFFFALGVLSRFNHWPGGSILVVFSTLGLLVVSVGQIIEGIIRKNPVALLFNLTFNFLITFLMFRIQFWVGANLFMYVAVLLFIAALIVKFITKIKANAFQIITTIGFIAMCTLYTQSAHKVYYVFNLTETFHDQASDNPFVWDKYSYFLNTGGKQEAAIAANKRALKIAKDRLFDDWVVEAIQLNQLKLITHTWNVYEPLDIYYHR